MCLFVRLYQCYLYIVFPSRDGKVLKEIISLEDELETRVITFKTKTIKPILRIATPGSFISVELPA